jgi:Flp pilus assembly protein TadD
MRRARELCTAAIALAPRDHELHYSLGVLHAEAMDERGARASFRRAAQLYPHCPRPHGALGSLALGDGRVAEALSHFETARKLAADEEEGAWWEAAVNGALCATLLAEDAATLQVTAADPLVCLERGALAERLEADVARLRTALASAPADARVVELLRRAVAAFVSLRQ